MILHLVHDIPKITLIARGNLFLNVEVDNCFCKLKINQFQFDSRLLI